VGLDLFRIHGHESIVRMLRDAVETQQLHHAYFISGAPNIGKTTLALQLAQAVNCDEMDPPCGECSSCRKIQQLSHADVVMMEKGPNSRTSAEPDESDLLGLSGIEFIRSMRGTLSLKPYEGRIRVFIIQDIEQMHPAASSAILKILEEPPPQSLIILTTSNPDSVVPTIISRCQIVGLQPLSIKRVREILQKEFGVEHEQLEEVVKLSRGRIGWALDALQSPDNLVALHRQLERITDVARSGLENRFHYADDLSRRFFNDQEAGFQELTIWVEWARDVLLLQKGMEDNLVFTEWRATTEMHANRIGSIQTLTWIKRIQETSDALHNVKNVNAKIALELLMIDTP
jgi:DNA polymerase-3 subunit delta'